MSEEAQKRHPRSPFFDDAFYSARYPDVAATGMSPLEHYLEIGIAEDREPNALFHPTWYRSRNPELCATGQPPLDHYLERGAQPGIAPNPRFERYAAFFRDGARRWEQIEADPDNPLREYLARGFANGVDPPAPLELSASKAPVVSVVIPVFNQAPHTLACLRSLAQARCNVPFEVIVADDASTRMHYPDVLSDIAGVRVLRSESNRGFVLGCNAAADLARGRFVLFLNNDTTVCDDWLDELVASFERFANLGIAGSKTIFPNGVLAEAGGIVWRDGGAWNVGRHESPSNPEFDYARDTDYVSGAALMIERTLFESLGGFDERFCPAYYEDTDLAFRVREAGRRVLYQPTSEVVHFEGASQGTSLESGIKAHQVVNAKVFFERWEGVLATHGENAVEPEREKDRTARGEALVIDASTPRSTREEGSRRLLDSMLALRDLGLRVTFMPEDFRARDPFRRQLRGHGIRVLTPPHLGSIDALLEREGERFDVCLLGRPLTAWRRIESVRAHCPNARVLLDAVDRLDIRVGETMLGGPGAGRPAEISEITAAVDGTLIHEGGRSAGRSEVARERTFLVPPFFPLAADLPDFDERRDILVLSGQQRLPVVDGLCWLRDEVVPLLPASLAEVRFVVRECSLVSNLEFGTAHLVGLPERAFTDAHAIDRFRVAVAVGRFGHALAGAIQAAFARGLPCVASGHTGKSLPSALQRITPQADSAIEFADTLANLYEETDKWRSASSTAREVTGGLFSQTQMSAVLEGGAKLVLREPRSDVAR